MRGWTKEKCLLSPWWWVFPSLKMRCLSCPFWLSLPPEMDELAQTFMLETEWLDSMQSLIDSRGNPATSKACELSNEISLLKINLEEKFRNWFLERGVNRLQQEIAIINSYRNGSVIKIKGKLYSHMLY